MKNNLLKVSEVQLTYKTKIKTSERIKVTNSEAVADVFKSIYNINTIAMHESSYVMLLNAANKVLGVSLLSEGGIDSCIIDVRKVMQLALKSNAVGIILCHNHPSGNLIASDADKRITKQIKEAGIIMSIKLLDHIILSPEGNYFSFADEGII